MHRWHIYFTSEFSVTHVYVVYTCTVYITWQKLNKRTTGDQRKEGDPDVAESHICWLKHQPAVINTALQKDTLLPLRRMKTLSLDHSFIHSSTCNKRKRLVDQTTKNTFWCQVFLWVCSRLLRNICGGEVLMVSVQTQWWRVQHTVPKYIFYCLFKKKKNR